MAALGRQRPGAIVERIWVEGQSNRLDSRRLTVDASILDSLSTSRITLVPRCPLRLDQDRDKATFRYCDWRAI